MGAPGVYSSGTPGVLPLSDVISPSILLYCWVDFALRVAGRSRVKDCGEEGFMVPAPAYMHARACMCVCVCVCARIWYMTKVCLWVVSY